MRLAMRSVPESGATAPVTILMRVDFPAPFSPTRAWTSPARRSKETCFSARTPEYDFEIPLASRSGMRVSLSDVRRERGAGLLQRVAGDAGRCTQGFVNALAKSNHGSITTSQLSAPAVSMLQAKLPNGQYMIPSAQITKAVQSKYSVTMRLCR